MSYTRGRAMRISRAEGRSFTANLQVFRVMRVRVGHPDNWHWAAKRVFFLHGEDARGKVVLRENLTRERLLPFLANQAVSTIAIEAACGAHQWARAFSRLGHQVPVIHPKFVRTFVKRIDQREGLAPSGFAGSWPGEEGKSPRSHCKNAHIAWRLLSHETFYEEALAVA